MTEKRHPIGAGQPAASPEQWFRPSKEKRPYTGDGKTKRNIFDGITVIFRKGKK